MRTSPIHLLGPLFDRFCSDLHAHLGAYADRSARALFMARGGLRLRLLYEAHLNRRDLAPAVPYEDFYVSRVAVAKAALLDDFDYVAPLIIKEFPYQQLGSVLQALISGWGAETPGGAVGAAMTRGDFDRPATVATLKEALFADTAEGDQLRDFFAEQSRLLAEVIRELRGAEQADHLVVVDTGWSGGTQAMLQRRFPEITWRGLYFGRYNYGGPWLPHFRDMVGIVCEDGFTPRNPATSFFLYRHVVESACEMPAQSVFGYERTAAGAVQPTGGMICEDVVRPGPDDTIFGPVFAYVSAATTPVSVGDIARSSNHAAWRLMRALMFPSPADVNQLSIPPRSADFGKDISYPAHRTPASGRSPATAMRNVSLSLWPEGQIALEMPWLRLPLQVLFVLVRPHARRIRQALSTASRAADRIRRLRLAAANRLGYRRRQVT